ncbi:MAG: hypothetical protein HQL07_06000 [Nitrospirae bacterium]|nr:hypothetical protein [Magnetococcales bacterium]HAT51306.1 hypothetical protein [Alphaproteobacteria bacterium]
MKTSRAAGVVRHEVHCDGKIPVRVTIWLKGEIMVTLDLVTGMLKESEPGRLSEKKQAWVIAIAEYLARQELLQRTQNGRENRSDGTQPLEFDPRPDGQSIWWG